MGCLGGLLARLGAILGVLEHLGALCRPFGALLERLGRVLGVFWSLWELPGCVDQLRPPLKCDFEPPGKGEGGRGRGTAKTPTRLLTPGKRGSADSRRFAFTARPFQFSPDEANTVPRRDVHISKMTQDPPQVCFVVFLRSISPPFHRRLDSDLPCGWSILNCRLVVGPSPLPTDQ